MNQSQPPKDTIDPAASDADLDNAFEPTTELNAAQLRAHLEALDTPSGPQERSDSDGDEEPPLGAAPPRREAALLEFDPDEATAFAPPRPKKSLAFNDLDPLPAPPLQRPPVGTLGVASTFAPPQAASGRWRVHQEPPVVEREPTVDRAWGDLVEAPPSVLERVPPQTRPRNTSWAADIEREAAAVEAEFQRAHAKPQAPSDHYPTAHLPIYQPPAREDLLPIPVEPTSSRSHHGAHSDEEDEVEIFTHTHVHPSPHRAAPTSSPGYFGLDRSARARALAHLTDDPFQEAPTLEYEGPRIHDPPRPATPHADPVALMRPHHPAPASLERLAVFPLQAAPDKAHLLVPNDPDSEVASKYRMLDFKLKMIGESRPTRTIALTSPQAGSGTSLTALNLALTRAESPHTRVVVVDLNIHAPSLAQQVGVVPQATLPDLLARRASLDQVLLRMQDSQCYLLPSNPVPEQAARFYKSTELTQLFGQLYDLFDLVVMDLPPILPHADINQINALIDVIVLVVAAGRTQGPSLRQATQMIDQEKIVGVILNDFVPNA